MAEVALTVEIARDVLVGLSRTSVGTSAGYFHRRLQNVDGDGDERTSMGSLSNTFDAAGAILGARWKLAGGSELAAH